jgi:hypothetical protein
MWSGEALERFEVVDLCLPQIELMRTSRSRSAHAQESRPAVTGKRFQHRPRRAACRVAVALCYTNAARAE